MPRNNPASFLGCGPPQKHANAYGVIDSTELGRRISAARNAHKPKLTQEELAARAGLTQSMISQLERGAIDNPGWLTIRHIEDGLDLRAGTLTRDIKTAKKAG